MPGDHSAVRLALRQQLAPALRARGYIGYGQQFRQIRRRTLELIAIRIDRQRTGFAIELLRCELYHLSAAAGDEHWPGFRAACTIARATHGPPARLPNPACALESGDFPGWRRNEDGVLARAPDLVLGVRDAVAALPVLEAWFARPMGPSRR